MRFQVLQNARHAQGESGTTVNTLGGSLVTAEQVRCVKLFPPFKWQAHWALNTTTSETALAKLKAAGLVP